MSEFDALNGAWQVQSQAPRHKQCRPTRQCQPHAAKQRTIMTVQNVSPIAFLCDNDVNNAWRSAQPCARVILQICTRHPLWPHSNNIFRRFAHLLIRTLNNSLMYVQHTRLLGFTDFCEHANCTADGASLFQNQNPVALQPTMYCTRSLSSSPSRQRNPCYQSRTCTDTKAYLVLATVTMYAPSHDVRVVFGVNVHLFPTKLRQAQGMCACVWWRHYVTPFYARSSLPR